MPSIRKVREEKKTGKVFSRIQDCSDFILRKKSILLKVVTLCQFGSQRTWENMGKSKHNKHYKR